MIVCPIVHVHCLLTLVLLLSGLLNSGLLNAGEPEPTVSDEDRRLFALIDDDNDQVVPLMVLAKLQGLTAADNIDPRMFKRLALYDANQDGNINIAEFGLGRRAMIDRQLNRMMATDVNGDGMLTLKEYALGMPDPKGKVDDNGFTKRQIKFFEQYDSGSDGAISKAEFLENFTDSYRKYFEIDVLTLRMMNLDRNDDGGLDLNEYAQFVSADGQVTDAIEKDFKKSFTKIKGKLTRRSFRGHLADLEPDAMQAFRQRIDAIETDN